MSKLLLVISFCFAVVTAQNVMVATGWDGYYVYLTDVIDVEQLTSCPNLAADFPVSVYGSVGIRHNDKMTVCGGLTQQGRIADCYSFSNYTWNIEAFTLEPIRSGASSAEIEPGKWIVLGGYFPPTYFQDTLIFENGIFTPGSDMPEGFTRGSAVMLNTTTLFVASGFNGRVDSQRNFLYDIQTDRWFDIANRTLPGTNDHSSGTFYNSSAGEIQVANIGFEGIEVYSPKDDSWHSGFSYPAPINYLFASATIQQGPDSFLLIGGSDDQGYNGDVFKFDENGLVILKEDILEHPRRYHVAMNVSDVDYTCQ